MGMHFHPPTCQYPYPSPAVPIPMSAGGGFERVWVWVSLQLPMGYPCYSLHSARRMQCSTTCHPSAAQLFLRPLTVIPLHVVGLLSRPVVPLASTMSNWVSLSRMDFRLFKVKIDWVWSGFECGIKIRLELKLSWRRVTFQFDCKFGVGSWSLSSINEDNKL